MKTAKVLLGAALLGIAGVSQAGFIPVDVNSDRVTMPVVITNDFKDALEDKAGILNYTLGASLGVNQSGSVAYYYYGKEAGYRNDFTAGSLFFTSDYTPQTQDFFDAPKYIGTVEVAAGLTLDFGFCAYSAGLVGQGCVSNEQNDLLGFSSVQSIALNITDNVAWLFWDDSGAGPDDNHDDMLIKAVFTPHPVPEPATLALFALGLLGAGAAARRRTQV